MTVSGFARPGYEGVRDAFERILASGADTGAAFTAVRDGEETARLPGISQPVSAAEITDSAHMADVLARQAPCSDPRAVLAYHPLTFGWLCGELIRRVDGRSAGEFFAGEFASTMSLDVWIGLPADLEQRVARLEPHESWPADAGAGPQSHDPLWRSIGANPPVFDRKHFPWNSRLYHAAEIPGAGAIASARSMARFYGGLPDVLSAQTLRLVDRKSVV